MDRRDLPRHLVFGGIVLFVTGTLWILADTPGGRPDLRVLGWALAAIGGIALHAGLVGLVVGNPARDSDR